MIFQFYLLPEVYVFTKSLDFNKHSLLYFSESDYNTSIIEKSKAIKLKLHLSLHQIIFRAMSFLVMRMIIFLSLLTTV